MTDMTEKPGGLRIDAIDRLRALTMVLMIFVNDLWSLKGVPVWMEHVESGVDGMGLADTVFPAFLFIVGLSLPFAIDARRAKGEGTWALLRHVALRAVALIVMGVFLVNGETINEAATGLPRLLWNVISCAAFILVWNVWPKSWPVMAKRALQGAGLVVLALLIWVYRGGETGADLFAPQWWGILGLIGWAYLAAGIVVVLAKDRLWSLIGAWAVFAIQSMVWSAGLVPGMFGFVPEPLIGGTMTALTLGGVVVAQLYQTQGRPLLIFAAITAGLVALYALTRPVWGLSKLAATPAWLFICSAITLAGFSALTVLKGKGEWAFRLIRPAGTDTLLCYLVPYFAYAGIVFSGLVLPEVLLTGPVGLLKSLLFAIVCVLITGVASRLGVRLKL